MKYVRKETVQASSDRNPTTLSFHKKKGGGESGWMMMRGWRLHHPPSIIINIVIVHFLSFPVTMKLSFVSFLTASALTATSAFVIFTPSVNVERTSVVLAGSRRATKWASKQKWLEARGFDIGMASATTSDSTAAAATGIMKNDNGLEYVKLVHPETGASSEIYLFGGVVTSYKDGEGQEFIAVRPDAKMDGSKPISGGLSHCWPQVG